jgi:hypothetical protein
LTSTDPAAEYADAAGVLWIPSGLLAWRQVRTGYRAVLNVEGAPESAGCRVVVLVPRHAWPAGTFSLLWRDRRLVGLDLSGPPHTDARGRPIATPHLQWIDRHGRKHIRPVDLCTEGIATLDDALRWFLNHCGLQWRATWQDPPV